jgi:hypothetical protein
VKQLPIVIVTLALCAAFGLASCTKKTERVEPAGHTTGTTEVETPQSGATISGTSGAPTSTMTIAGNQLPPPPQKFEGTIEQNAPIHSVLAKALTP